VKPAPDREALQRKITALRTALCPQPGGCIVPPIKIADKKPVFPASQSGAGGLVRLHAVIDTTGHVSEIRVVGDANAELADAAIAAVKEWAFEPTRLNGVVVDTEMNVSVAFKPTR
jgi:TonB family protein